ncbi:MULTISPECIES: DUF1707 SHOCT-like domain-containing protein [Actinomadura]|uniref:DUF1707 domain-containing protein n=1 Tax=Actinomadura yumaensis TaxID=111807 RepID=A0ABW2CTE5_9ACTN|nr:DUF1707 domain-containing protein [Actinomadura sp. J1-007]MWK37769.1 DUF1707 domain-containing protein [Actinomadura sp. J1-007]
MTRTDDIRVGDAERDAVTAALHEHFAAGRLDREELDERLDAALAAKTFGALRAIVDDLPGPNGLPDRSEAARAALGPQYGPAFGPGSGVPFRPFEGPFGHPVRGRHGHARLAAYHGGRPARGHGHRHPPFAAFPVLMAVFLIVTFTAGAGVAILTVLHIAMIVWIVRALALAISTRRARRLP